MVGAGIGDVTEIYVPGDVQKTVVTNLTNVDPCKGRRQVITHSVVNDECSRSRNWRRKKAWKRVSDRSNRESPSDFPEVARRTSTAHLEVIGVRREAEGVVAREVDRTVHGTRVSKRYRLRTIDKPDTSRCQYKSRRYFDAFREPG